MNSIDVSLDFSFKGKQYTPSLTIDLDDFAGQKSQQNIYYLIAKHHQIDSYSYLYEVMESSNLSYKNPQGLAKKYYQDGYFDLGHFISQIKEEQLLDKLLVIAKKEMNIESFSHNLHLQQALLQAYYLGKTK